MPSIIFTYDPDLSIKFSQFTIVLTGATRSDGRWFMDPRALTRHGGDIGYLADHVMDRIRFKMALESELGFRKLEARSFMDPSRFDMLRIHPGILEEFITRCQNQGVLLHREGHPTSFAIFKNVIPGLAIENDRIALFVGENNFEKTIFLVKHIPITAVFQNQIYQLAQTITHAFLKSIPAGEKISEKEREKLLMDLIHHPDKISIRTREPKKIIKGDRVTPVLDFDPALRKARLYYVYDNVSIVDTDTRKVVFDPEKNMEVHRNLGKEKIFSNDLKKMGFFFRPRETCNWFLSSRSLASIYPALIQKGFLPKVNHRALLPSPDMQWKISCAGDHIYAAASFLFESRVLPADAIIKAHGQGQSFFKRPDGSLGLISDAIKQHLALLLKNGSIENGVVKFKKSDFAHVQERFKDVTALAVDAAYGALQSFAVEFEGIRRYPVPESLQGILRDYQVLGYNWLRTLMELKLNGILADDMGLGKTLQVLCLVKRLKEEKCLDRPILLVVPKTLIFNWEEEIHKFTPDLTYGIYSGSNGFDHGEILKNDIILTTYGQVRQHTELFCRVTWQYVILDEAQAIKNPDAMISKAVKRLTCRHKLSMTGTPVENSATDLWSQFDFLAPGFLHGKKIFLEKYSSGKENFEALHSRTKPYILRRLKGQVEKELPEKTEITLFCNFTKDQKTVYDKALLHARQTLDHNPDEKPNGKPNKKSIDILQLILRLRQIACHPALALQPGPKPFTSGKLNRVCHAAMEILAEGHKMLIFSQFTEHLQLVRNAFAAFDAPSYYLDGKTMDRKSVIHGFKDHEGPCAFFISLKTGGAGLNLSEANYVFLLDPWWNPAVENQAIDRSHRIGQQKPVLVYRFITKNSIEEKVILLKEVKEKIEKALIDESAPAYIIGEKYPLDENTMKNLILG